MGFNHKGKGSNEELLKEMFEWNSSDSANIDAIIKAWTGVVKVAANELKRTLKNTTLVMNMWLDPRLKTGGQIDALFAKHDKAIEKINQDGQKIMDSICQGEVCKEADMMMMLANPALWITMKTRDSVKSITPKKIDQFFDETGINDVPIVGGLLQWSAKKAVAVGQIATLSSPEYSGGSEGGGDGPAAPDVPKRGIIDRLYGIFLLQNPMSDHHWIGGDLLTEENAFLALLEQDEKKDQEPNSEEKEGAEEKDETEEFRTLLIAIGVNEEMKAKMGDPFVAAHREFCEELVTHLEDSVADAVAIAKAEKLDDFVQVFANAKAPELKSMDVGKIEEELRNGAMEIISNQESLEEFLKTGGKTLEDFGVQPPEKLDEEEKKKGKPAPGKSNTVEFRMENQLREQDKPEDEKQSPEEPEKEAPAEIDKDLQSNDALVAFIMQALYDQNVAPERKKIFEGIGDFFQSGWLYVLNGLDEGQIEDLRGAPTGDELYDIITDARDRLSKIFDELKAVQ